MARLLKAALGTCLIASPAAAMMVPPRVEVRKITKKNFSSLAAGMVGVGDCFAPMPFRELQEIAFVGVEKPGPWERSAEHLAKQAAAEIGANCLMPLHSYDAEGQDYPVVRQYRAFVVTTVVAGSLGGFRVPASARSFPPLPQDAPPEAPPPPQPSAGTGALNDAVKDEEAGWGPAWFEEAHMAAHEIVIDTSRMSESNWAMVRGDIERYFPKEEAAILLQARAAGETVTVDLKRQKIRRQGAEELWPPPHGRLASPPNP